MTRRQLHSPDRIKNKMRLLRLPRFAQQASISTAKHPRGASPLSIGQPVFKDGTNAQSWTEHITPPLHDWSPEHGVRFLGTGELLLFLQSLLTKTYEQSVKR